MTAHGAIVFKTSGSVGYELYGFLLATIKDLGGSTEVFKTNVVRANIIYKSNSHRVALVDRDARRTEFKIAAGNRE